MDSTCDTGMDVLLKFACFMRDHGLLDGDQERDPGPVELPQCILVALESPGDENGDALDGEYGMEETIRNARESAASMGSSGNTEEAISVLLGAVRDTCEGTTQPAGFGPRMIALIASVYAQLGSLASSAGSKLAAVRYCDAAIKCNCNCTRALKTRGTVLFQLNKYEQSLDDLRKACQLDWDESTDATKHKVEEAIRVKKEEDAAKARKAAEELRKQQEAEQEAARLASEFSQGRGGCCSGGCPRRTSCGGSPNFGNSAFPGYGCGGGFPGSCGSFGGCGGCPGQQASCGGFPGGGCGGCPNKRH